MRDHDRDDRDDRDDDGPTARRPRRLARARRVAVLALAAVGLTALVGLTAGTAADLGEFDRTSGGYEAPYTGWTGTPIDWTEGGVTSDGFRRSGRVVDVSLDCTSGMITFHVFGVARDFRTVSPRAIAVHEPREACTSAGFAPRF